MPHRLGYATPPTAKRVRVAITPDGSAVIEVFPSRPERIPKSMRAAAGVLAIASTIAALYFRNDDRFVMCIVFALVGAWMLVFLIRPLLVASPGHGSGTRLRVVWRGGILELEGPGISGGVVRLSAHDVHDIRVDFDGGTDSAVPHMRMTLCLAKGAVLPLLADQDPADLLWLADTFRRFVGLPDRAHRMATWFATKAAGFGPDPSEPRAVVPILPTVLTATAPASPVPAPGFPTAPPSPAVQPAPVLTYATPERTKSRERGVEFKPDGVILWLPARGPYSAFISATVSRIQVVWHEAVLEFPCASVYGVYVGAAADRSPSTLYVCTVDGVHGTLTGVPPESLRDAARLLNDLLSVEGSVEGIPNR